MEDQKVTKKSRRQDSGSEFEEFDEDNSESSDDGSGSDEEYSPGKICW